MSTQVTFDIKIDQNGNIYLNKKILSLLNWNKQNVLQLKIDVDTKTATITKKISLMDIIDQNIKNNNFIELSDEENKKLDEEIQAMLDS